MESCSFDYKGRKYSTDRIMKMLTEELSYRGQNKTIKWLKDTLNVDDNEVDVILSLLDNKSLGRFQTDIKTILSGSIEDTSAFERVFRMYLSPDERLKYYQDFKRRSNYKSLLEKYIETSEESKIEKYLNDEFSDFLLNTDSFKSPDSVLFQRLYKFINTINNIKSPNEFYDKVLNTDISVSKYNPYFTKDQIIIAGTGFTVEQKQELVQSFTQRLLNNILKQGVDVTEFLAEGSDNLNTMIQYTKDQLVDDMENTADPDQMIAILDDFENLDNSEIWNGAKRQLELIGITITEEKDDEYDGSLDEETQASREFSVSFEVDPKASMSVKLKLILASLTDGESTNYKFNKPVSWTKAYTTIATRLAGVPTSEFMNELKVLDVSYKNDLIEILEKNFNFRTKFISEMSKTINEFLIYKFNKGEAYLFSANANTRIDKIVRDWKNNLIKNSQQVYGSRNWSEEMQRLNDKDNLRILTHLGIIPDSRITDLSIARSMTTAMQRKKFAIDPNNPFQSLDIEGYVKQLAEKQAQYEEQADLMARLADKKLYTLGLNTQQTILLNSINYAQSKFTPEMSMSEKIDILKKYAPFAVSEFNLSKVGNQYVINNKWLEKILDGEKIQLVIPYLSENSNDERTVDKLDLPDLLSLHINGALSGINMSMKHSDRSTFFAYKFNEPLYTQSDARSEDALFDKLVSDIVRVIENEVKVTNFIQDNDVAVQHLTKKELKDGFAGMVSNPNQITNEDIAKIKTAVQGKFNDFLAVVKEQGLVNEDLSKTPGLNSSLVQSWGGVRIALVGAFVNEVSSHLYESMLFSGDLRGFKNADDLFKRLAPQSSSGTMMVVDPETNEKVRTELDVDYTIYNPLTKQTQIVNPAKLLPQDITKFRSATLAERENYISKLLEPATYNGTPLISKLTGNQESTIFMVYEDNFLKDTQFRELNSDADIIKKIRLYEDKYSKANENDGLTYTTLPTFKQDRMRLGDWNDGFELVYRIEMELAKYSNLNDAKDMEIEFKGYKFKPFDLSNSNFATRTIGRRTYKLEPIHTLKSQFAGYSVPESLQADVDYAFNTIIKTSDHVLLPSAIVGTNLQLMNYSMLSNGINFLPMGSANKVGGVDAKIAGEKQLKNDPDNKYYQELAKRGLDFYSEDGIFNHELLTNTLKDVSYLSDWSFRKDQVRIGNYTKEKIKGSTQSLKILLSNLIINGEERFPGAEELVNQYKQIVDDSVRNNRDELFKEIGYNGEFESLDELRDTILKSTQVKNSADNVKNSIINFFANPELGLETVPLKNKIENVIYSLISNNVISFDRPGSSYPQTASTGYEPYGSRVINSSNDDAVKFYTFEFDTEGNVTKVNPAEIIIPLPMDWIKPLMKWAKSNNLIEAIDELNKEIQVRPDDFQVKGLRIPNQQLSSNGWFQIKKFNLPTMQNYMVVPTEIVVSMGSDYDVDSVKTYWEDVQNKIFQLDTEESIDQQLLNLEKQILLHPRNAHNLLLPVTDELFVKGTYKSLLDQGVIKRDPSEMINAVLPHVNAEKAIIFVKGKFMVGPVALTVTGNSVKQADKFGNINTVFGSQDNLMSAKLRFPELNTKFNMDNAISSNGGLISEILSQLLSISVDNVKNPVAELQNINMQTISIVSYLIERGLDEISIVNFINQPIIKEYLKAQKANESLFNKETGNELNKKELIEKVLRDLGYDNTSLPNIPDDWVFENKGFKRNFDTNQLYVLTYFLELVDQARAYGTFNSTQNSDTKPLKDKQVLDEMDSRLKSLYPTDSIPLVPTTTVTRVNTNGIVSPFYKYGRESYKIFNPFYAIENSIFGSALRNLKDNYAEFEKGSNKDRIRQAIDNDFQLFLIHNFVLLDDFDRLFKGDNSLPRRIFDLKTKLPSNLVLQAFLPMINSTKDVNNGDSISNLRLFEKELLGLDEQAMSVSLEEIASNDLELYQDLVKFLMFQTGLNLSPFNYSKILPVGLESERFNTPDYMYVYQDMIQSGLTEMKDRIKTKEQAQSVFEKFKILFDLNNARYLKTYPFSPHPVMKVITGYEMTNIGYYDSNRTNVDGSMRQYQLLGNSYQKRYNMAYLGNMVIDENSTDQYFPVQTSKAKTYSGLIKTLSDNQVFVFGSNPVGINGNPSKGTGGAALVATNNNWVRQNEKMDNRLSDSGKAWGLTTVSYPGKRRSKSSDEIKEGIRKLYDYAIQNPDKEFLVAYTGTGTNLNGYSNQELANMFSSFIIPNNIVFEEQFSTLLVSPVQTVETSVDMETPEIQTNNFVDTEYQYYGATYSIQVEDGIAVSVIGYSGKSSKEQRLLDAYNNNPNVDPQNNRQFRGFNYEEASTGKSTDLDKYELFPGVFANEGQKEAIDLLTDFLNSNEEEFTLVGRGGTGKTTIIKKILGSTKKKVGGITVAHKAKKVLGKSIGKENVQTVAAALAIKFDDTTGNFTPDIFARENGKIPINKMDIIIVDEASMISPEIYQEIMSLKKSSAKVIFMGDNAQLPPVGETDDSPVFDIKNKYVLTEKMRQAKTSPIINVGTVVADNVESANPKLIAISDRNNQYDTISNSSVIFTSSTDEAINMIVNDIKRGGQDVNFVKAVTFNNERHSSPQSVKNLNERIRQKLFGLNASNQFNIGEMVTAYDTYSRDTGADSNETPVHNSEDFIVTGIELHKKEDNYVTAYSNKLGQRRFDFSYDVLYVSLLNEDGEPILGNAVPVVANSSRQKYEEDLNSLWKTDPQLGYALKNNFANIQYGYAITSHKAQGSTYTNTYVFEDNILGKSNAGDIITKNKSLYVAVSRPTTKLVLISNNNLQQQSVQYTGTSNPELLTQVMDNNVNEIQKNADVELSTLQQEVVNNWDQYFPGYDYFNIEEKIQTAKLIESGELTLQCKF